MLKLKRFNEGIWYDFPNHPGVKLKIKSVSKKDILDIRAMVKRKMAVKSDGHFEIVDDYDEASFVWELFRTSLEEWQGISIDQVSDLKLEREDYLLAMFENDDLRKFVFEKTDEGSRIESQKLSDELKNSEGSQSG